MAIVILIIAGVGSAFDFRLVRVSFNTCYLDTTYLTGVYWPGWVALENAVENVVSIQFAVRNQSDFAISVILNSSLQVALGLTPVLVLISFIFGATHLTLVMPALLVASLALAAILSTVIIYDGELTWLEGMALIGLYSIIAISFWWG